MIHRILANLESRSVSHQPAIVKKVLLEPGELPGLTNFSHVVFTPGDSVPAHSHEDMWEVFFVCSGSGWIRIDGIESALERDACWVVQPGEVHEISNGSDTPLVLLYFGLETGGRGAGR